MFRGIAVFRGFVKWWHRRPVRTPHCITFVARFPSEPGSPEPASSKTGSSKTGLAGQTSSHLADRSAFRSATEPSRPLPVHRQRVLAMQIAHCRICPAKRSDRLAALGIVTCDDLVRADLRKVASKFASRQKALSTLKRYRAAIRMASSLSGVMPIDALVLIGVHRRSVTSLAMQNAAQLRLDLIRFATSSSGRATLRGRQIPSLRRIKSWIAEAEKVRAVVTS